jgi:hypothetical protein
VGRFLLHRGKGLRRRDQIRYGNSTSALAERARTRFLELQILIEAIERAIASEQRSSEVADTQR